MSNLALISPLLTIDSFGGFEYGYQQGVLGQSLVMTRFMDNFPSVVKSAAATGWLTSILQLGGILGSLSSRVFGKVFPRSHTMFSACCWVVLGSYLYNVHLLCHLPRRWYRLGTLLSTRDEGRYIGGDGPSIW
jgi:hypothetical protein